MRKYLQNIYRIVIMCRYLFYAAINSLAAIVSGRSRV